ncbi:hypothetical protein IJ750_01660 [bacterium]|nr:hypothetical protein [bacterium]
MQVNRNIPNFKAAEIKPRKPEPKPDEGTKPTGRAGNTDATKLPDGKVADMIDNAKNQVGERVDENQVGERVDENQESDTENRRQFTTLSDLLKYGKKGDFIRTNVNGEVYVTYIRQDGVLKTAKMDPGSSYNGEIREFNPL